jgi:hypothetical protein
MDQWMQGNQRRSVFPTLHQPPGARQWALLIVPQKQQRFHFNKQDGNRLGKPRAMSHTPSDCDLKQFNPLCLQTRREMLL